MDLYKELNNLKANLKEYRELLKQLYPEYPLSSKYQNMPSPFAAFEGEKGRRRNELMDTINNKREALVEKASYLSTKVTQIVGIDTLIIYEFGKPRTINVWDTGLRSEYDYRTAEALNACIDYTIKAAGKLKTEGESWGIELQKLEKVRSTKASPQKLWTWIESHKILSILGALAAIATIIGVVFAVLSYIRG